MASAMFRLPMQGETSLFGKTLFTSGGAQSRSTSAGSLPSDQQSSVDLQKSFDQQSLANEYPNDASGLPEYEYPTPWAIKREARQPEVDYPSALIVKNTFIDFDVWRSPSFDDFYKERQTRSCPVSGSSLPPGLEDLFEREEAAAKMVAAAAQATLHLEARMKESTEDKAMPLPIDHLLPSGLLDDIPVEDEAPPLMHSMVTDWQSPVAPATPCAPTVLAGRWRSPVSPAPPHAPVFDIERRSPEPHVPLQVPKQPVVLDLAHALSSPLLPQEERMSQRPAFFAPGFCPPPIQTTHLSTSVPEAKLGSPECPTVGSQSHWVGTCKPCAFLHTKGCDNGVGCAFCHLCDKGEKKRRAKDKRVALRK